MASGGHMLLQSKANLEARIKTLINSDLKEICKAYGYQVSGTKAVLQKRCLEILEDIVSRGDITSLEDLRYRLNNRGSSPQLSRLDSPSNSYPTPGSYQSYNMAPQRGGGGLPDPWMPKGGKYFKPSPFYEVVDTIMPLQDLPDGPEMPQNRHTVRANFTIGPELAQQFRSPASNLKILMCCGMAHSMSPFSPTDVAFPNQIEVKVNDVDVKANFKGLKNKSGSTKPADITNFVRKFSGQQNTIQVTYALTTKRYAYVIYLAKYIDAKALTARIKNGNIIPKQRVLDDMSRANADPDIAATSIRMSLKDPVSTMRITLPVRSSHCTHNQCFDGAMFLQLQEQAPQWSCPVCNKSVVFESLCVDKYFEDILNRTPKSIEKVDIEPTGHWTVIKEEGDDQPNGVKPRASYDDDFDDDIVELDQPSSKQLNGIRNESQPSLMLSPIGQAFSMSTPPLSSREPSVTQSTSSTHRPSSKRTQGAIIDLTLSDDDEPPRPAKRQSTNHHSQSNYSAQSRGTPTSIPDRSFQPLQNYISHHQQTDNYRPTSNHSQPLNHQTYPGSTTQNMPSPSNPPPSPLRASPYGQPAWPAQHPRPSTANQPAGNNNFQPRSPFVLRPPSAASNSSIVGGQQQGGLRLPPMQTHQQHQQGISNDFSSYSGHWRYDYGSGSYSQSPG